MKVKFSSIWRVAVALVLALSLGLAAAVPAMADTPSPVDLKTAANFAVLAGSEITNTGTTTIIGDVGSHPIPPSLGGSVILNGTNHGNDDVTAQAKTDLAAAYSDVAGRTPATTLATELGGTTLTPGVYDSAAGTFGITTGILTLDAGDNVSAVFIFQMDTTLITAASSTVNLINGARADNVFWQVGSSATLGASSTFKGNILALTSISVGTGATVDGRLLATNGAVTLAGNTITVPPTWISYSDPDHTIPCDIFDDFSSEHTVYMSGPGFVSGHPYKVAYYDGTDNKRATDDVTSGASGNVSSQHTFNVGTDTAGTWYVIVCEQTDNPPSTYVSDWASTIVTDTFTVQAAAIPEFPTVATVVVTMALCGGIYLMLKRNIFKQTARRTSLLKA